MSVTHYHVVNKRNEFRSVTIRGVKCPLKDFCVNASFLYDICILTKTTENRLLYFLTGNIPVESVKFPKPLILILKYNHFESVPEMRVFVCVCIKNNIFDIYVYGEMYKYHKKDISGRAGMISIIFYATTKVY